MTNEEILEAEELSGDIRRDLQTILARTHRPDELVAFVLEAAPRMLDSFNQLVRHRPTIFGSESDHATVYDGLHEIKAVAELAELSTRQPEYKEKLIEFVKTQVHRVHSVLLKTEQALQALWVAAPMTNEEILEAEKVIASLKNDLTILTGTTDAEKLTALVNEKAFRMVDSLSQLRRRHRSTVFVSVEDLSRFSNGLVIMVALAEMAERRPDYKARLLDAVAKNTPLVEANLGKIAHALREMRQ